MRQRPETPRYILGLKLRKFRRQQRLSLKDTAAATGLSVSYLSEIETGRKYPKPEKILALSEVLKVPFDDLVSLKVDEELSPVADLFDSPFLREFPFHLYGLDMETLLSLLTGAPSKASAMLRTAVEIGRTYDVRVEHLLFAALRSYQHQHHNYFKDIEHAADAFATEQRWHPRKISVEQLQQVLETSYGYRIANELFADESALQSLRSIHIDGKAPRLLLNDRLLPSQKAFQMAREIGFLRLRLKERSHTSSPLKVDSFDQVIHDFKAAYFAGALLIPRDSLLSDIESFFKRKTWSPKEFLKFLQDYRTTPETFFYRLSQLLPRFFGLKELFFLRLNHTANEAGFRLSKILNMSPMPIYHGLEPHEHYCRRWTGIELLGPRTDEGRQNHVSDGAFRSTSEDWTLAAQRATFVADDLEFFVITLARPLMLSEDANTSVSLGFLMDRSFKRRVRFWKDQRVPQVEVGLTCERCSMSEEECSVRAAMPELLEARAQRQRRQEQLAQLIAESTAEL